MLNHWNLHSTLFIRLDSPSCAPFSAEAFRHHPSIAEPVPHKHSLSKIFIHAFFISKDYGETMRNAKSIITQKFGIFRRCVSDGRGRDDGIWYLLGSSLMFLFLFAFTVVSPPPPSDGIQNIFSTFIRRNHSSLKRAFMTCFFYIPSQFLHLPPPTMPQRTKKIWLWYAVQVKIEKCRSRIIFTFIMTRI